MYTEALIFLRFGCYVHNPDAIFSKSTAPIEQWISRIQAHDNEWGYRSLSGGTTRQSVICIGVPSTLHHALSEFDADYMYTEPSVPKIRSILTSRRNLLRLTESNIKKFIQITKTTPAELLKDLESYLERIEVNPMQPIDKEELDAIKALGINWRLASRLPRIEDGGFEPIYIVDEHHRIRCL